MTTLLQCVVKPMVLAGYLDGFRWFSRDGFHVACGCMR